MWILVINLFRGEANFLYVLRGFGVEKENYPCAALRGLMMILSRGIRTYNRALLGSVSALSCLVLSALMYAFNLC